MMQQDFVRAARSRSIGNQGSSARKDMLRAALQNAYILKGVPVNAQSLSGTVSVLDTELAAFGDLRTGELEAALRGGVTHLYGEDDFLSAANIIRWVRTYMTSAERREALNFEERERARRGDSYELTAAQTMERERAHADFIRTAPTQEWNNFVAAGGQLEIKNDGYAAAIYDALEALGKVHPSATTYAEARSQAERDCRLRRTATGIASALDILGSCGGVLARTKRLLLERYFRALYDRGVTPNFNPQNTNDNDA